MNGSRESSATVAGQSHASAGSGWHGVVRGNVLMMGLVSLLTDFSSEMMNPLLPSFVAGLVAMASGGSGEAAVATAALVIGIMEGVAETTASLLKIFSGRLSDKLNKRKAIVIGGYGTSTVARPLMSLAPVAAGVAGAAAWVVGLKFLDRVGKGFRTSPRDALIGDSVGADVRGLAFSFHRAMDHTGAVLGPVASIGILYAFLGYGLWAPTGTAVNSEEVDALRWLFAIALLPGIAAMAVLIGKVREIVPAGGAGKADVLKTSIWRSLPGRFYAFVGIVSLFALGNSSDMFLLLVAIAKFRLSLLSVIGLWIALHISKIVFSLPGGMLSDRLGRRGVIVAGWIIYAAVYIGIAMSSEQWQFWALFVAYGFYYGMTEGAEKALVADFIPSEHRGTAFGIYHGAIGIAALPASLMFGLIWEHYETAVPSLLVGACLAGAASALLIALWAGSKKIPATERS